MVPDDGAIVYRIARLEQDVKDLQIAIKALSDKHDRLILTFVTGSISVTVAIVAATLALIGGRI